MKKIYLVVLLQIVVFALFAQKNETISRQRTEPLYPMKDKQAYEGYTIRLMPAITAPGIRDGYGFDILQDKKPVVHQFQNPLLFSPKGVQNKEDAYKVAQWMIHEYKKTRQWPNVMPPHIAQELKIQTH